MPSHNEETIEAPKPLAEVFFTTKRVSSVACRSWSAGEAIRGMIEVQIRTSIKILGVKRKKNLLKNVLNLESIFPSQSFFSNEMIY